jgi:predicted SnoaL-like aldol condensation-catalyzing enzyme
MIHADDLNEFCRRWLRAWTGNRPQELVQFYAGDAYYQDPARPGGLRGSQQLLEYFTRLLRKNPDWVWTATEVIPTAKGLVLKWTATIPQASSVVTVAGLDILEIREGKITRNEVYFDRSALS